MKCVVVDDFYCDCVVYGDFVDFFFYWVGVGVDEDD